MPIRMRIGRRSGAPAFPPFESNSGVRIGGNVNRSGIQWFHMISTR
jgi:hypothetical protein